MHKTKAKLELFSIPEQSEGVSSPLDVEYLRWAKKNAKESAKRRAEVRSAIRDVIQSLFPSPSACMPDSCEFESEGVDCLGDDMCVLGDEPRRRWSVRRLLCRIIEKCRK